MLPALGHATANIGARTAATKTKASEQDPAESQQSESLPEVISGHPNSVDSSQFHKCINSSPPIQAKTTIPRIASSPETTDRQPTNRAQPERRRVVIASDSMLVGNGFG